MDLNEAQKSNTDSPNLMKLFSSGQTPTDKEDPLPTSPIRPLFLGSPQGWKSMSSQSISPVKISTGSQLSEGKESFGVEEFKHSLSNLSKGDLKQSSTFDIIPEEEEEEQLTNEEIETLKKSVTAVQRIKMDNERKSQQLYELTKQVHELSKYKQEAEQAKKDASSLKEQIRLIVIEKEKLSREYLDKIKEWQQKEEEYKNQIMQLNEKSNQEKSLYNTKISEAIKNLETVSDENRNLKKEKSKIEQELKSLKEEHNSTLDRLIVIQEEFSSLKKSKMESDNTIKEYETRLRETTKENFEQKKKIDELENEIHQLTNTNDSLMMNEVNLKKNLAQAKESINQLNEEVNLIPKLKDQLHMLSDQIEDLKKEITHKSSLLDLEKENHTRAEEKVKDLTNEMTDLKSKLNEANLNNIELQSTINNLKLEKEGLIQQIDDLTSMNEQLKNSLSQATQSAKEKEMKLEKTIRNLQNEFAGMETFMKTVIEGGDIMTLPQQEPELEFESMSTAKKSLMNLKTQTINTMNELSSLRKQLHAANEEITNISLAMQNVKSQKEYLERQLEESQKALEVQKEIMSKNEEDIIVYRKRLQSLEYELEQVRLEEKTRFKFIHDILSKFKSDVNQSSDFESTTWDKCQMDLCDLISKSNLERQELNQKLKLTQTKLQNCEEELETTKLMLKNTEKLLIDQKSQFEKEKESELEKQRVMLEEIRNIHVAEQKQISKNLEQQLKEVKEVNSSLVSENKRIKNLKEKVETQLHNVKLDYKNITLALQLISRCIRPMFNKMKDLKLQKMILLRALNTGAKRLNELTNLFKIAEREFDLKLNKLKENKKTSFRAAVIAVIAARRFIIFGQNKYSKIRAGEEDISLLPNDEIKFKEDTIPILSSTVDNKNSLLQLFMSLDNVFLQKTALDLSLIRGLNRGLMYMKIRSKNVPYLSEDSNSPVQVLNQILTTAQHFKRNHSLLKEQITYLESENAKLQNQISEMEHTIQKKQESINFLESKIYSLEAEAAVMIDPKKYNGIKETCRQLKKELTSVKEEKNRLSVEVNAQARMITSYKEEISQLKELLEKKDHKLDKYLSQLKEKQAECLSQARTLSEVVNDHQFAKDRIKKLEIELEEIQRKAKQATQENEFAFSRFERMSPIRSTPSRFKEDLFRYSDFNNDLVKTLSQTHDKVNREVVELDKELDKARSQLNELQKNLKVSKKRDRDDIFSISFRRSLLDD